MTINTPPPVSQAIVVTDADIARYRAICKLGAGTRQDASFRFGTNLTEAVPLLGGAPVEKLADGRVVLACIVSDGVMLIANKDGLITGFRARAGRLNQWTETDYARPWELICADGTVLFTAPSKGAALTVRNPAEERLARALCQGSKWWAAARDAAHGEEAVEDLVCSVPRTLANRAAAAIVNTALANGIPDGRHGHLALLRAQAPSLRKSLAHILAANHDTGPMRDVLHQFPLSAITPFALKSMAGRSLREISAALGLKRSAKSVHRQAVGTIAHWLRAPHEDIGVNDPDLEWLTPDLCGMLPAQGWRQRVIVDVCSELRLRLADVEPVVAAGKWLAKLLDVDDPMPKRVINRKREIGRPVRRALVQWIARDPEWLRERNIPVFHDRIKLEDAIAAAVRTRQEEEADSTASSQQFALPDWALPGGAIPGSRWNLVRLASPYALLEEGRHQRHCVSQYAERCASGAAAVYSLRRAATSKDSDTIECPVVGKAVVGATVELINHKGRPVAVQVRGRFNGDPVGSAMDALRKITEVRV